MPAALDAIAGQVGRLNRYPDHALALVDRLAERHGVGREAILPGNGADALVGSICSAYLEPGDEVVLGWPSFVTYALDAVRCGAVPVRVPLAGGACDLGSMADRVGERTRLVFVCNPNNPTGGIVHATDLARFLDRIPPHVLVVVDEAYREYVFDPSYPDAITEHVDRRPNVAVLRTFSKLFGLAGLRVGYMVAAEPVVEVVGRCRHWFDVTDLGHLAAAASLDDGAEVERRRERNAAGRAALAAILERAGMRPGPAHGNFVYVEVGDGVELASRLAEHGVLVRSLEQFGAATAIRITVGSAEAHDALANGIRELGAPRGRVAGREDRLGHE